VVGKLNGFILCMPLFLSLRCVSEGKRFDPDMHQTLRLEFARSNTKVPNKQKAQQQQQHHQHHQQASLAPHHLLLQQQQQQQLALGRTLAVHPLATRT